LNAKNEENSLPNFNMSKTVDNIEEFDANTLHELLSAIYIQISRSYDVLLLIGQALGAPRLDALVQEHEQGRLLAADPWLEK
jgi:hypothetical protein